VGEGPVWVDSGSSIVAPRTAGYGATLSLPRIPEKVPSPILCRPSASC